LTKSELTAFSRRCPGGAGCGPCDRGGLGATGSSWVSPPPGRRADRSACAN